MRYGVFLEGAVVPTLDLDFYEIEKSVVNIYKLEHIMATHNIKELSLRTSSLSFEKPTEELISINVNKSVKILRLDVTEGHDFEYLDNLLKMMQKWFPNMKSLEVSTALDDPTRGQFDSNVVAAKIPGYYQLYQKVQSDFSFLQHRRLDIQLFVNNCSSAEETTTNGPRSSKSARNSKMLELRMWRDAT